LILYVSDIQAVMKLIVMDNINRMVVG